MTTSAEPLPGAEPRARGSPLVLWSIPAPRAAGPGPPMAPGPALASAPGFAPGPLVAVCRGA
ncbi:hypothetical protein AB0I99_22930, partial [Streptomyces spongiicola]